jgi:hypothetical protein
MRLLKSLFLKRFKVYPLAPAWARGGAGHRVSCCYGADFCSRLVGRKPTNGFPPLPSLTPQHARLRIRRSTRTVRLVFRGAAGAAARTVTALSSVRGYVNASRIIPLRGTDGSASELVHQRLAAHRAIAGSASPSGFGMFNRPSECTLPRAPKKKRRSEDLRRCRAKICGLLRTRRP